MSRFTPVSDTDLVDQISPPLCAAGLTTSGDCLGDPRGPYLLR
ncbi:MULTISPECIES: hypothetical protein [unclassified Streptomyces]